MSRVLIFTCAVYSRLIVWKFAPAWCDCMSWTVGSWGSFAKLYLYLFGAFTPCTSLTHQSSPRTNLRVTIFASRHLKRCFVLALLMVDLAYQEFNALKEKGRLQQIYIAFSSPVVFHQLLGSVDHAETTIYIKLLRLASTWPFPASPPSPKVLVVVGLLGDYQT